MSSSSESKKKAPAPRVPIAEGPERLQKILAAAGLGSRRKCEELISEGRVEVDRQIVRELGAKADRREQEIRVDGVPLPRPRLVYFMIHKPTGILSTNSDPSGRPRVIDLVDYPGRLFTVGRLDMSSEGLILATNDGELANRLTHPRYGVEKTYQVEVAGMVDRKELTKLREGVHLAEGFAKVASAKVIRQYGHSSLLEIVLKEGRNREIRRVLARVGHKVERLKRIAIGPLRLADLPSGQARELDRNEIRELRQAARGQTSQAPRRPKRAAAPKPKTKAAAPARAIIGGDAVRQVRTQKPAGQKSESRNAGKPRQESKTNARAGKPGRRPGKPSGHTGKPGGHTGKPGGHTGRAAGRPGKPSQRPAPARGKSSSRKKHS
jgi:23S rRNA pseudouridine2605 synthase